MTEKNIDTYLFDMDGTLIDTEKYYRIFWPKALAQFGYEMTDEQALSMRSLGRPFAPARLKEMFGEELDYYAVRDCRKTMMEECLDEKGIELKPGALELLQNLKARGVRVAVATATDEQRTEKYLQKLGIRKYFDKIVCATMVKEGKPSPDIYLYACEQMGRKPEECIAVEDSPNGVLSAYRAGCKVVMVPDQTQPDEELARLLYRKVDSLKELLISSTLGALEAGGTKMVCAIGDETGKIKERISIPTTTPAETIPKLIAYFRERQIQALGIGCFGPIDPDPDSETYGYITSTPKLAWQNYNIVGAFREALHCPVGFDTDVNASALGEAAFGVTKGLSNSLYLTVGTGIGAGILVNGQLLHGMMHPEAGHMLLKPHKADTYPGKCPFHGTCFEGLAAGPAMEERWGKPAAELTDRPEVWEMEAFYIAQALVNYTMVLSPERIVLGGGVMHQQQLFPLIREKYRELMAGYVRTEELADLDSYIVPCSPDDNQGIRGCLQLAAQSMNQSATRRSCK